MEIFSTNEQADWRTSGKKGTQRTTDQWCLKIDMIIDYDTVAKAIKIGNVWDSPGQPHGQHLTSEDLELYTLHLVAELSVEEVVPLPLPAKLGLERLRFKLLRGGDLPDLFSHLAISGDLEQKYKREIPARKPRAKKRKPEICSTFGKLRHHSSNRNCESYEDTYLG